ncbi:DinB family protein [Pseudactinotalea suaedae]|uniref:DinB family protein n=1 Tax=Pseudactinotalea suaedae TaxID=1524924 RepID=UPI0012E1E4C0|nr:DinB family protein [Pseudactinotalea suaedae]
MEEKTFQGDLRGARFTEASLRGARFTESDLSEVVMRGVDIAGADIDAPWLDGGSTLLVNGVDVAPFVEAELDRRFPGRAQKRAADPAGLRAAWAEVERAWDAALERAAAMPASSVEISVDGEWSFSQTLRHLVMATDTWLRQAVLQLEDPHHPIGQPDASYGTGENETAAFSPEAPPYAEVLQVRAERVAMVRDFIAALTPQQLDEARANPHSPEHPETVRSCLHTILEEEWEHLRFALRDLDAIEGGAAGAPAAP